MILNNRSTDIEKITITYSDGTTRDIPKGAVLSLTQNEDEVKMHMEFKEMSHDDVTNMVYGILQFGDNAGMLDDTEEDDEPEEAACDDCCRDWDNEEE